MKQWWRWVFLIPILFMAALCCFAIVMFKGNVAGTWSKRKRSRAYSQQGLETSIDTSEDSLSEDLASPRGAFHRQTRDISVSMAPSQNTQIRSPVHPQTRNVSVPMAPAQNTQIRHLSPAPVAPAARVMVTVPASPQLTSQQSQQVRQRHMSFATPQQSQVQGQQSLSSQQASGSTSLFDAIDQNRDGIITRDEFNRALSLVTRALVGSPSMVVARPSAQPTISHMHRPNRALSHGASSVQGVMSPVLMPGTASPLAGPS